MPQTPMQYDPPLLNAKNDKNGPHLAQLQANLMKAVADQEAQYQEPALTTNPFPDSSPSSPLSLGGSQQGRKRPLIGSPEKVVSPTASVAATATSGWGAPPLSPRTSLVSQRAKSPSSTTPMNAWQQESTAPNTAQSTTSMSANTMNPAREKTQIERVLFHLLLKLEAFSIQKDAVDRGEHRVQVVKESLNEAELGISSRIEGRPTKEVDTYMRMANEVLHKVEEIFFPDPHLLESEIAIATEGEQSAFQANIKLRHEIEGKDNKIFEQDEERKDLEMKLVQMEERTKALEDTLTAARYAQFQSKQQLVNLQLENIEYRKQVDKTSNTIHAAVKKKMGFVPWEAQKEIQNLATLTTAQVAKYADLVKESAGEVMTDP